MIENKNDTERDEIRANIDRLNVEIEKLQALVERETERLNLLPKPGRRVFEA